MIMGVSRPLFAFLPCLALPCPTLPCRAFDYLEPQERGRVGVRTAEREKRMEWLVGICRGLIGWDERGKNGGAYVMRLIERKEKEGQRRVCVREREGIGKNC